MLGAIVSVLCRCVYDYGILKLEKVWQPCNQVMGTWGLYIMILVRYYDHKHFRIRSESLEHENISANTLIVVGALVLIIVSMKY